MTSNEIRAAVRSEPFRPFVMRTTGGREYTVHHPEWVMLSPSGRTLVVVGSDDAFAVVDVLMIESINFISNGRGRKKSA
jgi:hypothetical protein